MNAHKIMNIDAIISFLSNKKTTIWAIFSAVVIWALGRGYVAQDTAQMIANIGIILGLGANVITAKYYADKKADDACVVKNEIAAAVAETKATCADPKNTEKEAKDELG